MNHNRSKKSRIFLVGSFLLFLACLLFLTPLLKELKEEVFSEMHLKLYEQEEKEETVIDENVTSLENIPQTEEAPQQPTYHYDYIGYLSIPKIGLRRGFVSKKSKYNQVDYNIAIAQSADFPNKEKGNFILMGHSGYGYNSYFANLHQLEVGDKASVTYKNEKYTYQLVRIDVQEKTGKIAIFRNFDKTTLTLITCTYQDDYHQSIYLFERI